MVKFVLVVSILSFLHCASALLARADNDTLNTDSEEITFILYNRNHADGVQIAINDTDETLSSVYIKDIDVKFITHGWLESGNSSSVVDIVRAYQNKSDYNLIVVDWSPISRSEYTVTTFRVQEVGNYTGRMVIRLIKAQLTNEDRVHLIGHSLGGQVVGNAGSFVGDSGFKKVARISGLDPALPLYEGVRPPSSRLDITDAQFVDVIHTSIGVFGYSAPLGHVDFYPNGGTVPQPGCILSLNPLCSHHRSYEYFAQSIYQKDAYPAVKCDSEENFEAGRCDNGTVVYMGNPTPSSARGVYYLTANFTGYN